MPELRAQIAGDSQLKNYHTLPGCLLKKVSKPWEISQQAPESLHFKEYTKLIGAAQTDHAEGFAINIFLSQFGISVAQQKQSKLLQGTAFRKKY